MSQFEIFHSDSYTDGRTKQAFKDQTDINKILARAARGDTISHLAKHGAVYEDFSDIDDLLSAHQKLQTGQKIFDELPGEIKREFHNDIGKFYKYVNDPAKAEHLGSLLPDLAAPGTQMPAVIRTAATEAPGNPPSPTETPSEPPPKAE